MYVHTARRYTVKSVAIDLKNAGFDVVRCTYWNTILFPLMVLKRKILTGSASRSDVGDVPAWLNRALSFISLPEPALMRYGIIAAIRRFRTCYWAQIAMTGKLLSIVVPVFNGSETIKELVDAVTRQPFGMAVEIVLVNDASTDNSQRVCEDLARTCSCRLP